ncbi:MAG: outer membrane beta-barrel family protein [Bacteroidota bacterium]
MHWASRFATSILLCLLSTMAVSQDSYQVRGVLVGSESQAVEFANIALQSSLDSSLVGGTVTAVDGAFILQGLTSGDYMIGISHLNFKDSLFTLRIEGASIDLGTVYLSSDANTLGEVVVKGTVPVIERKIDRINFNVQSSALASSGTVWEALKYAPGVQTDNQGAISLNGKGGITVMINERPLQLSAEGIKDLLESMSAAEISKIEVMSNPSAKYDAEGTGGIINIVRRKNLSNGFKGLLFGGLGQGFFSRYNGGLSLNYRQDRLLLSGYYNYKDGKYKEIDRSRIDYGEEIWDDENVRIRPQENQFANIGLEYTLSKKATLGVFAEGFMVDRRRNNEAKTQILAAGQTTPDSTLTTTTAIDEEDKQGLINVFYAQELNSGSLRLSANHAAFEALRDQDIKTQSMMRDGGPGAFKEQFQVLSEQTVRFTNFQADFEHDFSDKLQSEMGLKFSHIKTDNDIRHHLVVNEEVILDPDRSDQFKYDEYIEALYFNLIGDLGNMPYQIGLRAEYTQTRGESVSLDSITDRDYFRVFPSAFLQLPIDDDHELALSYSTRITRPKFFYLNPFRIYTNSFNYSEGNPFLQPSFSHSVELSYTLKGNYFFAFFYEREIDPFTQVSRQNNETKEIQYIRENVSDRNYFGITLSIPVKINDWWTLQFDGDAYGKHENDIYLGEQLKYTRLVYGADLVSQFRVSSQNLFIEISGQYASPDQSFFSESSAYGDLSMAMRKYFLNKKLAVSFKVSDILRTNAPNVRVNFTDQRVAYDNIWDSRVAQLSLRYRFGRNKVNSRKKRKASAKEEKNRIN